MPGKEQYEAFLAKAMQFFTDNYSEELKQKVIAHRQQPNYLEERDAEHKQFFEECDKDGDGMLNREEYEAYIQCWMTRMKERFGQEMPDDSELI